MSFLAGLGDTNHGGHARVFRCARLCMLVHEPMHVCVCVCVCVKKWPTKEELL